jgi:hypothetical protein
VPPQRPIVAADRAALLATLRADRERLGLLPPGSPAVAPRAKQGAPSAAPPPAVALGAKEGFSGPSTNSGDTPAPPPPPPPRPAPRPSGARRHLKRTCGSGRKFKRCCGTDAPPVLTC